MESDNGYIDFDIPKFKQWLWDKKKTDILKWANENPEELKQYIEKNKNIMTSDQKIQLRITALNHAEVISQQQVSSQQTPCNADTMLLNAQKIYDFMMKDQQEESSLIGIKKLAN